jgi:outer membrane protein assembly factor BamE (lipoprotein component of BamABCDE complex)
MEFAINKYDYVISDRYNGKYQLKIGAMWNDGKFHVDFKQIRKKDGSTQAVPVTLTFEDDDVAKKFFLDCLADLGQKQDVQEQPPLDDVPF